MLPISNTAENDRPVPLSIMTYSETMQKEYESFTSYTIENLIESGIIKKILFCTQNV